MSDPTRIRRTYQERERKLEDGKKSPITHTSMPNRSIQVKKSKTFFHTNYLRKCLTNQQMQVIQNLVPGFICAAPAEGKHSRFRRISEKPCWLQIGCADKPTFEMGKVGQLKSDEKTDLKVQLLRLMYLQSLEIITRYFPNKRDISENSKILVMMTQNPIVLTKKNRCL